jgi:hypothetical protein
MCGRVGLRRPELPFAPRRVEALWGFRARSKPALPLCRCREQRRAVSEGKNECSDGARRRDAHLSLMGVVKARRMFVAQKQRAALGVRQVSSSRLNEER